MRDVSYHDSNPMPLGPPIRTPTPAPQPREVRPGIIEGVDGRLSTDLPPPAPAPMPYIDWAHIGEMMHGCIGRDPAGQQEPAVANPERDLAAGVVFGGEE